MIFLFLLLPFSLLVRGHVWWREECRNKRVYGPSIDEWWSCASTDAHECLEELRMYLAQAAEEMCRHHACYIRLRRGTHTQVQLLRTKYLHFMTPRNTINKNAVNRGCQPKWTRSMEILANSIRQRANRKCQIDKDLLKYLAHLIQSKCQSNKNISINSFEELDPFIRHRIWKRRWASHRTPILEGSPHDQQMLLLPRRYPGIVPEMRLVPKLPMAMVQAAKGDMSRLGWTGSNGMINSPSMNSPSANNPPNYGGAENPSLMTNNALMMTNNPPMPNNQMNNAMPQLMNHATPQTFSQTITPQTPITFPQMNAQNVHPPMIQMNNQIPTQQPLNFNPNLQQQIQYQMPPRPFMQNQYPVMNK